MTDEAPSPARAAVERTAQAVMSGNLAQLMADITPRRISFKHCLQLWLAWMQHASTLGDEQLHTLFLLMAQQRVGNRSGRIEPRAVKRRPKAYPLLTSPRNQARENVRVYGHPAKLK